MWPTRAVGMSWMIPASITSPARRMGTTAISCPVMLHPTVRASGVSTSTSRTGWCRVASNAMSIASSSVTSRNSLWPVWRSLRIVSLCRMSGWSKTWTFGMKPLLGDAGPFPVRGFRKATLQRHRITRGTNTIGGRRAMTLAVQDRDVATMLERERIRQRDGVELIPSENYVSAAVLEAMGTIFTNKYSEGYPGRRYYGGNEVVDDVERLAQDRAKALFGVPHANVQPYSGSPANLAVYLACCRPGDPIMGLNLPDGGHLTHGWNVSATGTYYRSVPYHVTKDGYIDLDEVWRLARRSEEHTSELQSPTNLVCR